MSNGYNKVDEHTMCADAWLLGFSVGERIYIETSLEDYSNVQRSIVVPRSRRIGSLKDMEFSASLFTAVSSSQVGDIRYLVCVERTS